MLIERYKTVRLAASAGLTATILAYAATVPALPSHDQPPQTNKAGIVKSYGKLPLRFEANQGQTDPQVKYLSRGPGFGLFLTRKGAVLSLKKSAEADGIGKIDVVRMQLAGGSIQAEPEGMDRLPGVSNYLVGSNSDRWHVNVPNFARVRYSNVYPGVDLVYYGNQGHLEYDFVVAAGANPRPIQLHFEGAKGLELDGEGNLVIAALDGSIAFHKPVVYQTVNGLRVPVKGEFKVLAGNSVEFGLGNYDPTRELTIDPTLVYSTYLGGSDQDTISGMALDGNGNAYLTGSTLSTNFPVTPGAYESTDKDVRSSVFVTKLNSSGTALIYSTFLAGTGGPSGGDVGEAISVDSSGDAYVAGYTYSSNFPTTSGAYQTTNKAAAGNGSTGFITKLNPTGTALVYSTYLGGSATDTVFSIAVDSSGDVYVAGAAFSANFPVTPGVVQSTNKSAADYGFNEFVTKINPTGSALLYSTFLGGSDDYAGPSNIRIAIDGNGNAYVAGTAISTDFPVTTGAYQTTNKATSGNSDLTLSKLNPTATQLLYSTYLGGSGSSYGDDVPNGLAVDSAGNAYLTGSTWEANYPVTTGALKTSGTGVSGGLSSGFVTKMNATGTALVYSTYLGGSGSDRAMGLTIDSSGDAYITGSAGSTDFPVTSNAYQSTNKAAFNNGSVVFLSELNPAGSALVYSTYFGGQNSFSDSGNTVVLGASGSVYFAGITSASDFPITSGAYETIFNSQNFTTGFVSEFAFSTTPTTLPTAVLLTSSANPAVTGSNITFSASVYPTTGTGTPTGNVVFNIDQVNVATVAVNSKGYANYSTTTPLALGQHAILASYGGSTTYSSGGGNITQSITSATPTITPAGGVYTAAQLVTLADATAGAKIYYTTDGSTPGSTTSLYSAPILVSNSEYLQAVAVLSNAPNSAVAAASYTLVTAPTALAVPATAISTLSATLNALVSTNGMAGSYLFQYGTSSTQLTLSTPAVALHSSVLNKLAISPQPVSATLSGLASKTTYYYQVVVTTPAGSSSGEVLSFTTN